VNSVYESNLLGTAGTMRKNVDFFQNSTVLLAHADNWTCCDLSEFLDYHNNQRPDGTVMTMMTFTCLDPKSCGVVELDNNNIVVGFHEKVENPPGYLANAAVYLIEFEVFEWIANNPLICDFSTEVIPQFLGKIATWKNHIINRDIGTVEMLIEAQMDECERLVWNGDDLWQQDFLTNPIHKLIYR
jgi:mannose-1-phosphate guanylyltransferase